MAKKGIHPEWHNEAKVLCNGEEVLVTSGTRDSYTGALGAPHLPRATEAANLCLTRASSSSQLCKQ